MYTKFWSENPKGRDYSEDLGVDRRIILKLILVKYGWKLWTGCIWLMFGKNGWLF
jgi:hypothetical protein